AQDDSAANRRRTLQSGGAVLVQALCDRFRNGSRNRYSDGVSVRDQLGPILESGGRCYRTDIGDGGCLLVLPGIELSRRVPFWREAARAQGSLGRRFSRVRRFLAFWILHHRDLCLDAAPGRLSVSQPR